MVKSTQSPEPIVTCRRLTKGYRPAVDTVLAVRDVDLAIAPSSLSILAGPSGCGKTTLISLVAGLLDPSSGHVTVLDQRLDQLSDGQRTRFRRRHFGVITQHNNLLPTLTAAENVAVPLAVAGWTKRRAIKRACEVLDQVSMADRRQSLPGELSGGQQQRIGIARAIVHEPRLVICDEPTSALDHETGRTVMELLKQVAGHPERSVLMVTHDPRTFEYADRVIRMDDGRIEESN